MKEKPLISLLSINQCLIQNTQKCKTKARHKLVWIKGEIQNYTTNYETWEKGRDDWDIVGPIIPKKETNFCDFVFSPKICPPNISWMKTHVLWFTISFLFLNITSSFPLFFCFCFCFPFPSNRKMVKER